jgi:hypothetical protein
MAKIKKAQFGIVKKLKDKYDSFVKQGKDEAAYTKSSFKTADSLRSANPKMNGPKGLKGYLDETDSNKAKADSIEKAVEKRIGVPRKYNLYDNKKNGGNIKKAQAGKKMVPSEMKPGTMIKKADRDVRATKMADALDKQAGKGKYAPKPVKPKAKAGKMIKKSAKKK